MIVLPSQNAQLVEGILAEPTSIREIQPDIEGMCDSSNPEFCKCGQCSSLVSTDKHSIKPMHLSPSDALVLRQVRGGCRVAMQRLQDLFGRV